MTILLHIGENKFINPDAVEAVYLDKSPMFGDRVTVLLTSGNYQGLQDSDATVQDIVNILNRVKKEPEVPS